MFIVGLNMVGIPGFAITLVLVLVNPEESLHFIKYNHQRRHKPKLGPP